MNGGIFVDNVRPTRAEIYLDNLLHNFNEIRKAVGNGVRVMPVVKANAYGHGSYYVAKVLVENGADYLAVATVDEALELRERGISTPILVLGYTPLEQAEDAIEKEITFTVFDFKYVKELEAKAVKMGKKVKVHVKIDTGMGRIGYTDIDLAVEEIGEMKSFVINADLLTIFT